jgi:glycosyltransferase involved in cell wall biosynthesis
VHVPAAVVVDDRPVRDRRALHRPIKPAERSWRSVMAEHGPTIARLARSSTRRRWTIVTAAPSAKVAARWGDWHVAGGLADALVRLGEEVEVTTHDRATALTTRASDVLLVIRGLEPVPRAPGQRHVLWIISHPEAVDPIECDEADLVLVASSTFAEHLREQTSTRVEVFLQATEPRHFHPGQRDPAFEHPVTVVAKTRGVRRAIVDDALRAGLRPAIYGSGWRDYVDPELVVAEHVNHLDLPRVYCSAGVVLNDHWETMRAWGFVSNRIFDVLACGTPVISDAMPEITDLFGDAVPMYRTSAELGALVRDALDAPEAARTRAAKGREVVLAGHTFDDRAARLVTLLAELEREP